MAKKTKRSASVSKNSGIEYNLGDISVSGDVLDLIVEHSHDAVLVVNEHFKFEYVSEEGYKMVNATPGELIGVDFRKYLPDDVKPMMVQRLQARYKGEEPPTSYSTRIFDMDGNVLYVDLRIKMIDTVDGHRKALVMLQDRTQEMASQRALKESEERYRKLVETVNDGVVIDDKDGLMVWANNAFYKMMEYSEEELIGKPWIDFTKNKDRELLKSTVEERKSGRTGRYELEWVTKAGRVLPTIISAAPLFDNSDNFIGTSGVVTDISLQKESEETVQFYLDLLTHDVANQLQVIMTSTGLIDHELPKSYIDDARQDIIDAVERCNRLITKVKRAGQTRYLPRTRMDLSTVLKEKTAVLERVYNTEVVLEGVDDAAIVWADALLGELVWNLLENAARHNVSEGRRVWVSASKKNETFQLSISDNGPGISKAKKKLLFDKTKRSGGVGLTLVFQMVRKYGGTIKVTDRVKGDPSKGARFTITLKEAKVD
jgi:PAS domain S-box-containing protein